ncbi:MAG TPA: hypothetical protein VH621_06355 [Nitrososphaera sp.]
MHWFGEDLEVIWKYALIPRRPYSMLIHALQTYSESPSGLLKHVVLQLCTCTWIEILTGVGITAYLLLVLKDVRLAIITAGLFVPLVGFHFALTKISQKDDLVTIKKK